MSSADVARRAAVLGSPIGHSLSPVLHRAAYTALGLTHWRYDAFDVDGEALPDFVHGADEACVGFSVTMPGKAAAAAVADRRSARVQLLGVANTLVRRDGWYAENTDVDGVIGVLRAAKRQPRRPLVLGGGGTALAVVAALAELGTDELVVSGRRAASSAEVIALAEQLVVPVRRVELTDASMRAAAADCDAVFSTVPEGSIDSLAGLFTEVPVFFDAVYHPWPTPLAAAGGPNRITLTGLDLLLHQAFRQVELMTGQAAPVEAMRNALAAAVPNAPPLRL